MDDSNKEKRKENSDHQLPGQMTSEIHNGKEIGETIEEFDEVLTLVGSSGRYQTFLLYGSVAPIMYFLALISYCGVFTQFVPEHFCSPGLSMSPGELEIWKEENIPMESRIDGIEKFSSCRMYNFTNFEEKVKDNSNQSLMTCQNGWIFDTTDFDTTIPMEQKWVCEKNIYPTFVFTAGAVGMLIGNIIFGPMGDKFGRKPIFFISLLTYMVFIMISFFIPHLYEVYLVVTFLASTGFPILLSIPQLLMAELCDNNYRARMYTVAWMAWVCGIATVPLIGYLSRRWFVFAMSTTAPGLLIFLLFARYPESPRWLVSKGRVEDAAAILYGISKKNGTSDKITQVEIENLLHKIVTLQKDREEKVLGFWTLFSTKRLAIIICLIAFCWGGSSMIYEQITLNSPYMSGNQFLNFFFLALVEFPGSIVAGFLISRLGRRWTPVIFWAFMAVVCLVAGIGPQQMTPLIITCILLAKVCVTVTYYVVGVQATELFPTPLRVTGNAVCSTISSTFGLLNSTVVYTGRFYSGAPYLVMTLIAVVGCVCSSFLPETFRQNLPETIEDSENFGKKNKYWSLHPDRELRRSTL